MRSACATVQRYGCVHLRTGCICISSAWSCAMRCASTVCPTRVWSVSRRRRASRNHTAHTRLCMHGCIARKYIDCGQRAHLSTDRLDYLQPLLAQSREPPAQPSTPLVLAASLPGPNKPRAATTIAAPACVLRSRPLAGARVADAAHGAEAARSRRGTLTPRGKGSLRGLCRLGGGGLCGASAASGEGGGASHRPPHAAGNSLSGMKVALTVLPSNSR